MANLNTYGVGDEVLVFMNNIRTRQDEWREGKVVDPKEVSGRQHRPYTMLIVEVIRTYYNKEKEEFYDKLNTEGFVYSEQVKRKMIEL